jgi:hypothetical protein
MAVGAVGAALAGEALLLGLGVNAAGTVGYAVATVGTGALESWRLSNRRDAATVADWVATRPPSRLPGDPAGRAAKAPDRQP